MAGRVPDPATLRQLSPEKIYEALTTGPMKTQGSSPGRRTEAHARGIHERPDVWQRRAGRREEHAQPLRSESADERSKRTAPTWNGWSPDVTNSRFQTAKGAGLTADQVPHLKLKWAFGYPTGVSAFGQPAVAVGPRFRRQRYRICLFAGCEKRLRLLVLSSQGQRARRPERRAGEGSRRHQVCGVLRRRARQCLCGGCADRPGAMDQESGRSLRGAHHGVAEVV